LASVDPNTELERLQELLASRQSTSYFARFAIGLAVAMIVAGAAGKLSWDAPGLPYFGIAAALVAGTLAGWAIRCYRRGMVELKVELERFERWQALRRSLGIDDPSALLPRR
jgi:uncharacterized membrane protein